MGQAAVEQHVELNQFIERRVAHYFAHGCADGLVVEHQDVRADNIYVLVPEKEVDLSFNALSNAYVI